MSTLDELRKERRSLLGRMKRRRQRIDDMRWDIRRFDDRLREVEREIAMLSERKGGE